MRALFPGSFDPVTQGHREVLRRSADLVDEVVACVMINPNKTSRFPVEERLTRLSEAAEGLINVTVDSYTGGLLVDYCYRAGIDVIIRGVRNATDIGYGLPMVQMNHELTGIETLFIAADPSQAHISSSLVTATTPPSSLALPRTVDEPASGSW
jgi:pantetheine-phosphate adenylyltransferase